MWLNHGPSISRQLGLPDGLNQALTAIAVVAFAAVSHMTMQVFVTLVRVPITHTVVLRAVSAGRVPIIMVLLEASL